MKSEKKSEFRNRLIRKCTGARMEVIANFGLAFVRVDLKIISSVVGVISFLYFPIGSWNILMQLKAKVKEQI